MADLKYESVRFREPEIRWPPALNAALTAHETPDIGCIYSQCCAHHPFFRRHHYRCEGRIPALTKKMLREMQPYPQSLGLYSTSTSGTSGEKLSIFYSPDEYRFKNHLLYRPILQYDLGKTVSQVIFSDIPTSYRSRSYDAYRFEGRSYSEALIPAQGSPDDMLGQLLRLRPSVLRGFPSAMVRLAENVSWLKLRGLGVRCLSPSGEFLDPVWRDMLCDAFDAPVFDRYGATECGPIAWECPHCGKYHFNADELIIEKMPDVGTVITVAYLTTQPIIRYMLGDDLDVSAADPRCVCRLPTLTIKQARRDDCLFDCDGVRVSPLVFMFESYAEVVKWAVVQGRDGAICVYLEPFETLGRKVLADILSHVRERVQGRQVTAANFAERRLFLKYKRVVCQMEMGASADQILSK